MSFLPSLSPGNVTSTLPTDAVFDINDNWTRPTEWVDLNVPDGVPEKIIGLVAVFPNDRAAQNYVAFNLDTDDGSSYTVDWGDGNVETVGHNVTYHHVYDYDNLPSSTEFRGYRQARFEVTLGAGVKFGTFGGSGGQINFDVDGPYVTYANYGFRAGPNILDLFVSSSNATTHTINYNRPMRMAEQIEIRNTPSNRLINPERLYVGCRSLRSIPFAPYIRNAGSESYARAFYLCHSLTHLPDDFASADKYWFKNPSTMQETFRYCYALRYMPEGLFGSGMLTSCSSFYLTFADCRNLKYIPYVGVRNTGNVRIDYMLYNCLDLRAIPKGLDVSKMDGNGIDRLFQSLRECYDWSAFSDQGGLDAIERTSNFDMSYAFYNLDSLKVFPYFGQFTRASNATGIFQGGTQIIRFDSQYTYLDFTNCTDMQDAFSTMQSLQELPPIHVNNLTNGNSLYRTFYNCESLTAVKFVGMNAGPSNGEYYQCFYNAKSLQYIEGINFSYANDSGDYSNTFGSARNINYIKFPGGATDETGFKYSVALQYCPLNREAILEIFNHLCTISHSATLNLRNNSFTSSLTAADKLIATNKGWTLSL
tara:strand:- start:2414 stop:4189 length:1776 start_codon:yes stop_codon:yes gene_type:complete